MKGVKGMICDTSSVTADAGLHVRGKHILDLVDLKPEEILYLLLVGEVPDKDALLDLQQELKQRSAVPKPNEVAVNASAIPSAKIVCF